MMKFILNVDNLKNTRIQKFIDLSISANPVRVYKPRAGKVSGNMDKFTEDQLKYILDYAPDMLAKFGYADIMTGGSCSPGT